MHDVILNGLEDYLSGSSTRDFDAHLASCRACGEEVRQIKEASGLLSALQPAAEMPEVPGFYARLADHIDSERKQSLWSVFSLDPAFGRRVVFASLMTLGVLGSVLVSQERNFSNTPSTPEAIMAHDSSVQHVGGADRDRMFITLATYKH